MHTVAIVDDWIESRETVAKNLRLEMPDHWKVVDLDPLPALDEYATWIVRESITALVVDERLHEHKLKGGGHVAYSGRDVATHLRKVLPWFPIFAISAHPDDDALQEAAPVFENVLHRNQLGSEVNVARICRAAGRYADEREKDFVLLGTLAAKVAAGHAKASEKRKLAALQERLNVVVGAKAEEQTSRVLDDLERELEGFSKLKEKLERRVKAKDFRQ